MTKFNKPVGHLPAPKAPKSPSQEEQKQIMVRNLLQKRNAIAEGVLNNLLGNSAAAPTLSGEDYRVAARTAIVVANEMLALELDSSAVGELVVDILQKAAVKAKEQEGE